MEPLTSEELKLKQLWASKILPDPYRIYEFSEIKSVLDLVYDTKSERTDRFDENDFILKNLDCAFVKHPRYLPAFMHRHEFFEILYVSSGECINYIGNDQLVLSSGDFCFHAPETVHAISAMSDQDIIYNIILRKSTFEDYFLTLFRDKDILSSFFQRVMYQKDEFPYVLFHTGQDTFLSDIVMRAHEEYSQNRRFRRQLLNALLAEFFAMLLRGHEQHIEIPDSSQLIRENLVLILRYMEEHYTEITLHELAAFFNYSDRQMERIIQKSTGMTFMENIQRARIKKAENLLKKSNLPIEQIAYEVGYPSLNNFRRIFVKYREITPADYRKKYSS